MVVLYYKKMMHTNLIHLTVKPTHSNKCPLSFNQNFLNLHICLNIYAVIEIFSVFFCVRGLWFLRMTINIIVNAFFFLFCSFVKTR